MYRPFILRAVLRIGNLPPHVGVSLGDFSNNCRFHQLEAIPTRYFFYFYKIR
jgi:hypothetical protein